MDNNPKFNEQQKKLSDVIEQLRKEKGLSYKKLSGLCGFSASHLSRVFKDKTPANAKLLKAVAPHLEIDPKLLLEYAGFLETSTSGPVEFSHLLLTTPVKHLGKVLDDDDKVGIVKITDIVLNIK